MKCPICKQGETELGKTSVTFVKDKFVFVVRDVPADVCKYCGEAYVSEETTRDLLDFAKSSEKEGTVVNIKDYKAA